MHYLIRAKPKRQMMARHARSGKTPYLQHQDVWKLMSRSVEQKRDFLWRWDKDHLWILGTNLPEDREGDFNEIVHKEFSPKLREGMLLEFQVRLNPVIRIKENGARKKVDAVMHLKKKNKGDRTQDELNHEALTRWMGTKDGFEILPQTFRVDNYERIKFKKKGSAKAIQYSIADLSGILKVSSPEKFREILFMGLGSAKSFGCGLMLIKPAR